MSRMRLLWRWLACATMVLGLLAGDGLHELMHSRGADAGTAAASGRVEAHSGNCPCNPHSPAVPHHGCLLCQHGLDLHALSTPECGLHAAPPQIALAPHDGPDLVREALVPGALGARAPPLTSV